MKTNAHLIIISINMSENKTYVLSTDKEKIRFPFIEIDESNKSQINSMLIDKLIEKVYVENFLINTQPQFITIDFDTGDDEQKNNLNIAFGFLADYTNEIDTNCSWIEFNYMDPSTYNNVIFQTIQRLK